ncbi:hypothetical protein BHAP_0299 [Bifidobacterium hapali]|uniref:Uncharacterized protein n=1 Tax=Bifidobacterium hapali TaxID=1630172 RepID=A0A261G4R5_9BIFI|nr:hypothetical protein BHAP_0299 [Bifidobacterium hapali]
MERHAKAIRDSTDREHRVGDEYGFDAMQPGKRKTLDSERIPGYVHSGHARPSDPYSRQRQMHRHTVG